MLTQPTQSDLLAENARLRRYIAYYRQVIADCEIVCDPAEKAVDATATEKNTYPQANILRLAKRDPQDVQSTRPSCKTGKHWRIEFDALFSDPPSRCGTGASCTR